MFAHCQVITHVSEPLVLSLSSNHMERICFFAFKAPLTPLVLGHPWLALHNPQIDWEKGRITGWGINCHRNCLLAVTPSVPPSKIKAPPKAPDLSAVPRIYRDLGEVFCKDRARSLPPHRPCDCITTVQPSLQSFLARERHDGEIHYRVTGGRHNPSLHLPCHRWFLFVTNKDKTLRPCIDYRGLNQIKVKNKYSLSLLSSAFELLQGMTVFSKLDLRNAYHLMCIREGDEWKTAFNTHFRHFEYLVMPFGLTNAPAVFQALVNDDLRDFIYRCAFVYLDDILILSKRLAEHQVHVLQCLLENQLFVKGGEKFLKQQTVSFPCPLGYIIERGNLRANPEKVRTVVERPVPPNRRQFKCFLDFVNFYRRFIQDFSKIALPLTSLTSPKVPFQWNQAAQQAFSRLKELFSSAPILCQPDLSWQLIVEVDASDSGGGSRAVLYQQVSGKLHPCAFSSRHLSPAERSYHIRDRELLAIKLALEEWRHWLEGTTQPFVV